MTDIIAILSVFSVPVSAIWAWAWIKSKKLKLEEGTSMSNEERLMLRKVLQENAELKARIENVEMIVTGIDTDTTRINRLLKDKV